MERTNPTQGATGPTTDDAPERTFDGGDARDSAVARLGQIVAGTYRLSRYIGSGGSSHVYEGRHLRLGKSFAVKILRSELNNGRKVVQRFRREAETIARLHDEHIVSVVDTGELEDGTPYLTMELLRGEDLRSLLQREGPLPVRRVVQIALEACRGLTEVHQAGLVHRDLKPENLFITRRSSGEDWCKVLDFGVAKVQTSQATAQGVIVGTVRYMAPEQLAGDFTVGPSADVYAVGAILYECLTGKPLVDAPSVQEAMYQIMNVEPQLLAARRPELPRSLCKIIHQCVAKTPSARPTSAAELGRLLDEFLSLGTSYGERCRDKTLPDEVQAVSPALPVLWKGRARYVAAIVGVGILMVTAGGLAWRRLGFAAPTAQQWPHHEPSETQAAVRSSPPFPNNVPPPRRSMPASSSPVPATSVLAAEPIVSRRRQRQAGAGSSRTSPESLPVGHFDRVNPYE